MRCPLSNHVTPLASLLIAAIIAACGSWLASPAIAVGFRIETQIYVGDEKQPVSSTTTLFHEGVVYDFLADEGQIALFRMPTGKAGRFILLDPARRVRTELSTDRLARAVEKLTSWASRQKDPYLKFAANPKFEETFHAESGKLVLASHEEQYEIATTSAHESAALADYREFLDWYARLNTLLGAGPPPGPRLQVNAALARYEIVPITIELTRSDKNERLRAEHEFTWRLSKDDLVQIDDAHASLAAYREISNEEYLSGLRAGNKSE